MLALLDSAIAHGQTGDLAEAARRLEPVLSLPPDKRVELICRRSADLQRTAGGQRPARTRPTSPTTSPEFQSAAV